MNETLFQDYEEPTIRSFIATEKRDRYLQLLAKAKSRGRALSTLHHAIDFKPEWATQVDSQTNILGILQTKGAPAQGYLIGTSSDQLLLPLSDALKAVELEAGMVVCIPGKLAYYCGEDGERRIVLERPSR